MIDLSNKKTLVVDEFEAQHVLQALSSYIEAIESGIHGMLEINVKVKKEVRDELKLVKILYSRLHREISE